MDLGNRAGRVHIVCCVILIVLACIHQRGGAVQPVVRRLLKARSEIKKNGFAEYVPVAYATAGIEDEDWTTVDSHAMAHFVLYLSRDCTHFAFRWEIPHLILVTGEQLPEKQMRMRPVRLGGPGGSQILSFRNQKRNIIRRSCYGGYLRRTWTRGPFNTFLDRPKVEGPADEFQWGALLYCGIFLAAEDAAAGKPLSIYLTDSEDKGDDLSGFAVMEIPKRLQPSVKRLATAGARTGAPSTLQWQVKANLCNVTLKSHAAELKEAKKQYERGIDGLFTVCDVMLIAMSEGVSKVAFEYAQNCILEAVGVEIPDQWDVMAWMLIRPLEKAIENVVSIINVRVAHMGEPMPFYVSPWTTVELKGPDKGTDTWNRAEVSASHRDTGDYEWTLMAGGVTEWRARLVTRPSVITTAAPLSYGWYGCRIAPTHIEVHLKRREANWEQIDRHLIENYFGDVNAPCFLIRMQPKVNFEIAGMEALRAKGKLTTKSPNITRREIFHSGSVCVGLERLPRVGWEYIKKRTPSLPAGAWTFRQQEVEVTFNPRILPLSGKFTITPQRIEAVREHACYAIGQIGTSPEPWLCDYEEEWWYQTVQYNWDAVKRQRAYWTKRREEQLERWRTSTEDQLAHWRRMLGDSFDFTRGQVFYRPPREQISFSHKIGKPAHFAYLPTFHPIRLEEPIDWDRAVLRARTDELPDLPNIAPELLIDDDSIRLLYTNPKTDKRMGIVIPKPKRTGGRSPKGKGDR